MLSPFRCGPSSSNHKQCDKVWHSHTEDLAVGDSLAMPYACGYVHVQLSKKKERDRERDIFSSFLVRNSAFHQCTKCMVKLWGNWVATGSMHICNTRLKTKTQWGGHTTVKQWAPDIWRRMRARSCWRSLTQTVCNLPHSTDKPVRRPVNLPKGTMHGMAWHDIQAQ